MEIILKEDIKGLGYKNDLVKVRPGYGRNYLIPQGMAVLATDSAKKVMSENIRQAAHKAEKVKNDALALAEKLAAATLELKAKVGESGKIFGSITNTMVSDLLKAQGFNVDRKKIGVPEIKEPGTYEAAIDLHKEVKLSIPFTVSAE